jgi:predicted nucleotidyltransferase
LHMLQPRIDIPKDALAAFCRKWKIAELSLFGSVLRDDFRPDSDVDVLVDFEPQADWGLFDHVTMEQELSEMLGRKVDLVSRRAVESSANADRRRSILAGAERLDVTR